MAVITVSREYGSKGTQMNEHLLESLKYLRVDKQLIGDVLG